MIKIENAWLRDRVYNTIGISKNKELTEEILSKMYSIKIDGKNLKDEKIEYSLNDFKVLSNVESIVLEDFVIDDEMMEKLNCLENLECIEFSFCDFKNNSLLKSKIKTLRLSCCDFKNQKILENNDNVEKIRIIEIGGKEVDVNDLLEYKNIKYLYIHDVNIKNENKFNLFKNLKELNLDGCRLTGKIDDDLKNRVEISIEEIYTYEGE